MLIGHYDKIFVFFILFAGVLFLCVSSHAESKEKVTIVLPHGSHHSPPHYLIDRDGRIYGGIEHDILKAAFSDKDVKMIHRPIKRSIKSMQEKRYDCIAPAAPELMEKSGFYESKETFSSYDNRVIVLASSGFTIESVKELYGKRVLGFPGASKYLGDEFANMARENQEYFEVEHLGNALKMLFLKRIEVLVMDIGDFKYHAKLKGYDNLKGEDKVRYFRIFPTTSYTIMCTQKSLVTEFDQGKQKLRTNGQLEMIIEKNIGRGDQIRKEVD